MTTYQRCVTSLLFTNPLLWPDGIVKCPLDTHLRILPEVTFEKLFIYCFINTVNLSTLFFSHNVSHPLYSMEVCELEYSCLQILSQDFLSVENLHRIINNLGTFCHLFYELCKFRYTALFTYCFSLLYSRDVCYFGCSPRL